MEFGQVSTWDPVIEIPSSALHAILWYNYKIQKSSRKGSRISGYLMLIKDYPVYKYAFPNFSFIILSPDKSLGYYAVLIVASRGPNSFVSSVHWKPQSFQLMFFKFTPYISQTKTYMPRNFQHSAVPFVCAAELMLLKNGSVHPLNLGTFRCYLT